MMPEKKKNIFLFLFKFFVSIVFAFYLTPTAIHAQLFELEINQTEPDGPIPVFRNFQGKTGIIVESSQTNLQFDSNLQILDERNNPDEGTYRIIIEPVNQYVSVSAPGFMTSRIQMTNLQPNDVLYYSIEPVTFLDGEGTAEKTFQDIKTTGTEFFDQGEYYFALDRFNDALRLRPNNIEVTRYRAQAEDEIAWNNAKMLNTIEAYQIYINGNTLKQYVDQARQAIMKKHITLGETYVNNNNIELAEEYLQQYLLEYPSGPDRDVAKEQLCLLYETNGDIFALDESLTGQSRALDFYNKAKPVCNNSVEIATKIKETEKLYERYNEPTLSYTMFTHDRISTYGISFGSINYFRRSAYFTIRLNNQIFTRGTDFTVDGEGNTTGGSSSQEFTGSRRNGNAEVIIGINHSVYQPVWAYAGAGYAYNPVFWEVENFNELEWVRNTDESSHGFVFEFGAIVNVLDMNLSIGLKGNKINNLVPTISFGFITRSTQ